MVQGNKTLGFAKVETIADIQRCYEFRLTLEPEAAYNAASRRNDAVLTSMLKSAKQSKTKKQISQEV